MSENPDRIPLLKAQDVANKLRRLWGMESAQYMVAGSIRRLRKTVGDIEFTGPFPIEGQDDKLFHAMQESIGRQGGLFEDPNPVRGISGRALKGFKRNFKYCELQIEVPEEMIGGSAPAILPINVQIHRWVQSCSIGGRIQIGNRGWVELMRTGPGEFGRIFLAKWASHWRCKGDASEGGFLRNTEGMPIDLPTEELCFKWLNGMRYIPPEERDDLLERWKTFKRPA